MVDVLMLDQLIGPRVVSNHFSAACTVLIELEERLRFSGMA